MQMNELYSSLRGDIALCEETQEDPIVMYLICRESLHMSIGKACAQAGHVAMMIQIEYEDLWDRKDNLLLSEQKLVDKCLIYHKWLNGSFCKVTLGANDKEWEKVKSGIPSEDRVIVIDHGLTEIAPGQETFMAIWPMHKSQRPKILKKLQALK